LLDQRKSRIHNKKKCKIVRKGEGAYFSEQKNNTMDDVQIITLIFHNPALVAECIALV
jgi:hypothetical protein